MGGNYLDMATVIVIFFALGILLSRLGGVEGIVVRIKRMVCKLMGQMVQELINMGVPNEFLFQFVDTILNENCYHLMLALDGEASIGNIQMTYRLFDEDGKELTGSGDIEREAFEQFMAE